MLFYYVQIEDRHDPGVNIRGKASVVSTKLGALGVRCSETLSRDFTWQSPQRKLLGSKEHLDWLIIDSNAAKIIETVNAQKINANGSTRLQQCYC